MADRLRMASRRRPVRLRQWGRPGRRGRFTVCSERPVPSPGLQDRTATPLHATFPVETVAVAGPTLGPKCSSEGKSLRPDEPAPQGKLRRVDGVVAGFRLLARDGDLFPWGFSAGGHIIVEFGVLSCGWERPAPRPWRYVRAPAAKGRDCWWPGGQGSPGACPVRGRPGGAVCPTDVWRSKATAAMVLARVAAGR